MSPMIAFVVVLLNYVSFFLSILVLFKKNPDMHTNQYRLFQMSTLLFWFYSGFFLFKNVANGVYPWQILATIQIFCLASFWFNYQSAKKGALTIIFSKNLPSSLTSTGYYRWIRHPYYTIYIICYLSVALYLMDIFSIILASVISGIYYYAASLEEKKFLDSEIRDEYLNYRKKAGMFFPKIF